MTTATFSDLRGGMSKLGSGFLVVIVHFCALLVLVRHIHTSSQPDFQPVRYTTLILLPQALPEPSKPVAMPPIIGIAAPKELPLPPIPIPIRVIVAAPPAPSQTATSSSKPARPADEAPAPVDEVPAPVSSPARPRIDMDAVRAAARRIERERVPTGLERIREAERYRAPDDNDAVRAIKKAERSDCRHAYGGGTKANLLAIIPLVIDTLTDHGCKW